MSQQGEMLARALQARRSGSGWRAHCPAHEDRNPSLSIAVKGGKTLLRCHAGCEQRDVIDALKARGLWESSGTRDAGWREWRDGIRYPAEWGRIVCSYDYRDADGSALYSVVRFDPKNFRPGYFDGGRWTWKKHPRQVLYHLPEVLEAPIVFLVEGERDAETLREWGFVATTNSGGANASWLPQYTEALRGRETILIPDNDPPGRARVVRIARALLGSAARIIVWQPEGAKDISEWFARGHREVELIALGEGEGVSK